VTAAIVLAVVLAAPPGLPAVVSAEPVPELNAKFRRTEGWVGADGAYSVVLSDKRAVWLFSDTLVGSIRDGKRKLRTLVNNSAGVQAGRGAGFTTSFAIQKTTDGKPRAVFAPPDGKGFFWLQAGVHVGGKLYVFLPRVETTGKGGAFGFKHVGQWLGVVENPAADPTEWKIAYSELPSADFTGGRKWSFGVAALRDGEFVYVYGYEETAGKPFPNRRLVLARVPAAKLADFAAWRFYSGGQWKAEASDLTPLADHIGTEGSVSYVPGLKRYALVCTENGLGDRMVGRFAESPAGPWSEPVLLYRCPEMRQSKKVFSYAAKAHPHLGGENELVITYCVNAYELGPVLNDATLYWPNFVRVKLKP
jgi:hypothetical protein